MEDEEQSMMNLDKMQLYMSQLDNANDGIEEEPNVHETPEKELLWAAENNELSIAAELLKVNSKLVEHKDRDGYTPLHRACYSNHPEMVDLLLQHGADVNARTKQDWTPLHSSCKWDHYECAAKLIQYGADVNAQTEGFLTPLHIVAANNSSCKTTQLLMVDPYIKHDMKNNVKDTPYDVARRSSKFSKMFDMGLSCINFVE